MIEQKIDLTSNSLLLAIIEASDHGIFAVNEQQRITLWNPWLAERTGISEEQALHRQVAELLPGVSETLLDACAEIFQTGRPRILSPVLHRDLLPFTKPSRQMGQIFPLCDAQGRVEGVLFFIHDHGKALEYERYVEDRAALADRDRQSIFNAFGHPVFILDSELRIIEVNKTAEAVIGSVPGELVGRKCHEVMHQTAEPPSTCPFSEMRQTGRLATQEMDVEALGGTYYISCTPVFDEHGKLDKVIHVAMDITEKKKAEARLKLSEERYRAFVKQSSEAICLFEVEHAPIEVVLPTNEQIDLLYEHAIIGECNQIFAASHGYQRPADMLGFRIGQVFPRLARNNVAYLRRFIENGHNIADIETQELCRDGEVKVFLNSLVGHVEDGKLLRVWGAKQDISRIKQAEERFRMLIESAPDAILVQSEGRIVYANNGAARMFGAASQDDLLGRPVSALFCPEESKSLADILEKINKDKEPTINVQRQCRTLDGKDISVECSVQPLKYENRDGALIFIHDINERMLLEGQLRQAQKMEAVGRLAGGVAHDYNNMLTVILGYNELAMNKVSQDQDLYDDLLEIQNAAKRSMEITRQLLAFARKQTIAPEVLDLNQTVEGMLKMLRYLIGENIKLTWMPTPGECSVKIDPSQLDQILANLCINSRDAITDVGTITIETDRFSFDEAYCATHSGFSPGEYILLAVSDNGCGMDKATLENIFEPFFTTKETGRGTGLGLATVYGIARQNNGFINVYSEPAQGTVFRIYLPRHKKADEQTQAPDSPLSIEGGSETILLVEDELTILRMASAMLKDMGYTVLTASLPVEAVRLAHEFSGKIDLLLTDVIMPELSGKDLVKKLLSTRPDLKYIFMSGYTAEVIAHHQVLDPNVNFIQKPFSKQRLATRIRQALDE